MSCKTEAQNKSPPHILIFPYPAQGHTLPLLDLTHYLALHDFTLTILTTPQNLPTLSPLLHTHPQVQTLILPFPSHPSIPHGVENVKDIGNQGNFPIISALTLLRQPIIDWFRSHRDPPVAIISDFFLGWTENLATELGIPRIAFFSSGAFLWSVVDFCWNNGAAPPLPEVVEFVDLPRRPEFKKEHLPSVIKLCNEGYPDCEIVKESMIANMKSWGCVFNSFEGLEGEYLDYLKLRTGYSRVYSVGPLSLLGIDPDDAGTDSKNTITDWLNGCPDRSVIYICFGSQKSLRKEQMEALAVGLEMSGARFVWVVKSGLLVPDGFEERVVGRGLVVSGWVPQRTVLGHPAVGGFLSHCGWNSVLEGIVGGVVVLGWPMEADQFVNARLLVDDLDVAVRVCEGSESVPEPKKLAKAIVETLSKENVRAKLLKDKAVVAVKNGGSSLRDFDRLVKELNKL